MLQNFEEHLPNLRRDFKPQIMSELICDATNRSNIMAKRSRERDEMLDILNERDDKDQIFKQYLERTGGYSLFSDDTEYMRAPEYIFQNHLNILKELIVV